MARIRIGITHVMKEEKNKKKISSFPIYAEENVCYFTSFVFFLFSSTVR